MARIPEVSERDANDSVRLVYDSAKRKYGKLPASLPVTANHADVFRAFIGYEASFARADRVDVKLKVLASLKVAALVGCPFCIDLGSAEAHAAGITEAQLRDFANYRGSDKFSSIEKLVLNYAVAMTGSPLKVDEAAFSKLREHFDDTQLVELTATIAWENYRARFNHALGVDTQSYADGSYCVAPERGDRGDQSQTDT